MAPSSISDLWTPSELNCSRRPQLERVSSKFISSNLDLFSAVYSLLLKCCVLEHAVFLVLLLQTGLNEHLLSVRANLWWGFDSQTSCVRFPTILHLCKCEVQLIRWSCGLDWVQMDCCSFLISWWFLHYIISNSVDEKMFIAFCCRGIFWKLCSSSFFFIFSWGAVAWNTVDIVEQYVFSRLCFSVGLKHRHQFQCNDWPPTRLHQIRKVPFGRYCLLENYCCQPSAKLALLKWSEAGSWSRQKGSDCIQLRVVFCD